MKIMHFDAPPRAFGTCARKPLLTVATALAALSFAGTSHAQTATPTPGMTVEVFTGARQTLKMVGASEPQGNAKVLNDTGNTVRDKMMDLTYGDLKMKVVRLWCTAGRRLNYNNPPTPTSLPTAADMAAQVYRDYGGSSGFIVQAKNLGVTTLLLGPSFAIPDTPLPTPTPTTIAGPAPTATPIATPGPVESSMDAYTTRIAECINLLRGSTYGIQINATGLANEPSSIGSHGDNKLFGGYSWTKYDINLGVRLLRQHLDERGLQSVDIVAPETSNSDSGAAAMVAAMQSGTTQTETSSSYTKSYPAVWDKIAGIATHSYGMAASDNVGAYVQDANGASTKDWWMTEAGKVNPYGNDDVGFYEPTSDPAGAAPSTGTAKQAAVYLAARFLNDMNHGVTHWIWFVGYGVKPLADASNNPNDGDHDTDGGQKLVNPTFNTQPTPQPTGVLIRPKYWYFKQLRDAFPTDTVFRRSESSLDRGTGTNPNGMSYSYNARAHVAVSTGTAPDGTWRVGVLNLTPLQTDPGIKNALNYSATTYPVTVNIDELSTSGSMQFAVIHSKANGDSDAEFTQVVTATNGQIKLSVAPQELITLRSAPVVDSIHFYPRSGYPARMTGGIFQGSNGDKITGPWTTLATITTTPADNAWTTLPSSNTVAYRYLRYLSPNHSYGNVGEVKFYSNGLIVTGYPYGTLGTGSNTFSSGSNAFKTTYEQVYDVDHTTYFDTGTDTTSTTGSGNPYAGLDMFQTPGDGNGVQAQYFSNETWSGTPVMTVTEPVISQDWGTGGPNSVGTNGDVFSVRWTGKVQAVEAGTYSFRVVADNGASLYLGDLNNPIIDNKSSNPFNWTATKTLKAGEKVSLKYDFFEHMGYAYARLEWKRPGQANYEIVPNSQLFTP